MTAPYKIGDVSRFLNIPVDTIRFYQKQGVVNPERRADNNYHYFGARDVEALLAFKKHRGMEFSSKEILSIMKEDSFEDYVRRCERKQRELEQKAAWYAALQEKTGNLVRVLKAVPDNLGSFSITEQPEAYCLVNRTNDLFTQPAEFQGVFEDWMRHYPFIENYYTIDRAALLNPSEPFEYRRGLTIKRMWADKLKVAVNDSVRLIPRRQAVYTVVQSSGGDPFSPELFERALEFIERRGCSVSDDIQGNILTDVVDEGRRLSHMEVWIPIE